MNYQYSYPSYDLQNQTLKEMWQVEKEMES
jgi:hypothetical protein